MGSSGSLRDEFQLKKLSLSGDISWVTESKLLWPRVLLVYRLLVSVYLVTSLLLIEVSEGSEIRNISLSLMIYLTLTMYFILSTIVSAVHMYFSTPLSVSCPSWFCQRRAFEYESIGTVGRVKHGWLDQLCKLVWLLYNVNAATTLLVTIGYYATKHSSNSGKYSICLFIVNSVLMVVETIYCNIPVRILHVVYPLLFTSLNVVITALYWTFGSHRETTFLDYDPNDTVVAVKIIMALLVVLPVCHLAHYLVSSLRVKLTKGRVNENVERLFTDSMTSSLTV